MSAVARFGGKLPTICAACQRLAAGFAFSPNKQGRGPFIWLCADDANKLSKKDAEKIYKMPSKKMELWEKKANAEAETSVAEYCDEIGISDFSLMTEFQRDEVWRRFIVGREHSLRRQILNNEAPF